MAFPSGYTGYDTLTPGNPSSSLTDYFYVLNANLLSSTWWSNVKSDGGDVQAYKSDGTRLPVYLHNWNYGSQAGNIYIGYTGTKDTSSESIRLYAGNASESQPAAGASFGQHAVFPTSLKAFYPDGGGNDVTSNANHLTMTGSPTVGGVSGPISGSLATDYNGSSQYGVATASVPTAAPLHLFASVYATTTTGNLDVGGLNDGTNSNYFAINANGGLVRSITFAAPTAATAAGGSISASTWANLAANFNSTTSRTAYLNGSGGSANTTSATPSGISQITVGRRGTSNNWPGRIAFFGVSSIDLSADHIAYWHAMLADPDQSDFYTMGGWTAGSAGSSRLLLSTAAYFAGQN